MKHTRGATNSILENFQEEAMAKFRSENCTLARQREKCVISRRNGMTNVWNLKRR